jgi:manganese/zinc/iron transport system substrate-binding protein
VIFYSGLMLEGRMADLFVKIARTNEHVYAVTQEIDDSYLLEPPQFEGHTDPHVWMDVQGWAQCVEVVAEALSQYDPEGSDHYRANAGAYLGQLNQLDQYVKQVIGSIPEKQRVLITAHDAFNYFGRAYSLEVKGIQGISTESEAGLQDINNLVDFIVENNIKAVFSETSVSDKNVMALIEGAGARGMELVIGGSLFSDAMGAAGTYEGTYIGMIDHNATTVARALGGQAPPKGLHGKLSGHG